ncbi:HNH endonuclease, partial [Gordonia sp. zg691]
PGCGQPASQVEMHHAQLDWSLGGLTDITDLTPACPRHNRMVGDKPGQYTTWMLRDGPDEGRCVWRLNAEPGAPPNPARINRRPDVPDRLSAHLAQVRHEIHGPDTASGDTARLAMREVINPRPAIAPAGTATSSTATPVPATSVVETRLEELLSHL